MGMLDGAMNAAPGTFNLKRLAANLDRRIVQGSDNWWMLSFPETYGSDWSGFAGRAQLRADYLAHAPQYWDIQVTIVDPVNRIAVFVLPASTSETIDVPCGRWDFEIYNGTITRRICQGTWELNWEVTG